MQRIVVKTRFLISVFLCGLLSSCATLVDETQQQQLPVLVGGRVLVEDIEGKQRNTYFWPGVYFEAGFTGASVDVHLDDIDNVLQIIVDNNAPIVLTKPGKMIYPLRNLGEGAHHIRLEKISETNWTVGHFDGFFIPSTQQALALTKPTRSIEFIGDSYSVGYGNTSSGRECTDKQIFSTTNTQLAFGPLIAKQFDAAYQVNAWSGMGVVRNYNGSSPESSLVARYPFVLNDNGVRQQGEWSPQIIVIALGTNDFSTPLNPGEKWLSRSALQQDFVATYESFVRSLRVQHPSAGIIIISPGNDTSEVTTYVKRVVDNLHAKGEQNIYFAGSNFPFDLMGCHWHPSLKDHQVIAKIMAEYIEAHFPEWRIATQ